MTDCLYGACESPPKARGYCEKHFREQYIRPIQKERDNSQSIVDICNSQIRELTSELHALEPKPFFTGTSDGRVAQMCHKCFRQFTDGLKLINHEAECVSSLWRGKPKEQTIRTPRPPKVAKVVVNVSDDFDAQDEF